MNAVSPSTRMNMVSVMKRSASDSQASGHATYVCCESSWCSAVAGLGYLRRALRLNNRINVGLGGVSPK